MFIRSHTTRLHVQRFIFLKANVQSNTLLGLLFRPNRNMNRIFGTALNRKCIHRVYDITNRSRPWNGSFRTTSLTARIKFLQNRVVTLITCSNKKQWNKQGDVFPDNVKFPYISPTVCSTPAHDKCYSYHACASVIVSGGVGMQQCMIKNQNEMHKLSKVKTILKTRLLHLSGSSPLFPDKIFSLSLPCLVVKSLTFPWQLSTRNPDISRFSIQLITPNKGNRISIKNVTREVQTVDSHMMPSLHKVICPADEAMMATACV